MVLALVASAHPGLGGGSVAAQQTKRDTTRRDSVQILPRVVSTATIAPTSAAGVALSAPMTRFDADSGLLVGPRSVAALLAQRAGFASYDDLGNSAKVGLSSRGFFASPVVGTPQGISVFLDGVRMNEAEAAQVNFDLLPTDQIRKVEVLSGNGTLLGRNALGGAINLVSARGVGPGEGEMELGTGSFGARAARGHFGAATPSADFRIGGGFDGERGWRQATDAHAGNVLANAGFARDESGLRLTALYASSRAETAGSLPQSVYDVRPDSNLSAGDYEKLWQAQLALTGYAPLASGSGSFVVYGRRHFADRFNVNQPDDPDAFGHTLATTVGGTVDDAWSRPLGERGVLGVRVGLDGSASRTDLRLLADSTKLGGPRAATAIVRSSAWNGAAFALVDLTFERITWSAGLRYDHAVLPMRDRLAPDADTTAVYDQLDPRAGVAVDLGRGLRAYGSLGRAFRAPALIENACADAERPCSLPFALGDDPPLRPVTATTSELGVSVDRAAWQASVTAFSTSVRNDIFVAPKVSDEDQGTIDGYFVNLARTRRAGIETSARYMLSERVDVYGKYSYTRATFESAADIASPLASEAGTEPGNHVEPGDRLPLVPAHLASAGADVRVSRALSVGFDGRYVGAQWLRGDEANNTTPLVGYAVLDLRATVSIKRWEVTGSVANLFDRGYATFGTYNVNEGAPGGPTLERFLTPGVRRRFELRTRYLIGQARD